MSLVADTASEDFTYHGAYRGAEASKRYNLPLDRNLRKTKCFALHGGDPKVRKEELRQYFHNTFELYEKLFECLNSDESFYIQPVHKLRHPIIFYLGHTAAFYINKLTVAGVTSRINPAFEEMFATGVDEMSWDDLNEAHYNWPPIAEVIEYRGKVRDRVEELFAHGNLDLELPITFDKSTESTARSFYWVINMGVEHERIHLETMSVHVRELPMRLVRPHAFWSPCTESGSAPDNEMVQFNGGTVRVGRPRDGALYGWDCDYADNVSHTVKPFKASKFLVTNAEFYKFVLDNGYTTQKYWDAEGWQWVTWKKPQHPWFWVSRDGEFKLRTQVDEIPLPWDWPCEVNNLEARAFCSWLSEKTGRTIRLPTEGEWLLMRDECVSVDQHEWNEAPGNLNFEHYASSCPVTKFRNGPLYDVVGNVWQHTQTPVYPYKGYQTHPFYDDFSMPTFDGRHVCMKGGAWISTGNEATRDARYAFRRHFFQDIGIRYVEGEAINECMRLGVACLGMDPLVDATADLAYIDTVGGIENYPVRLANIAVEAFRQHHASKGAGQHRVLDVFCGAGRVAFELSQHFHDVLGVDFTARVLQPAFSMKERGIVEYSVAQPWGTRQKVTQTASKFGFNGSRDRVMFYQADPSNLHAHIKDFDLVVAWNVLERTYRPTAVVPHLLSRMKPGGILVLASGYNWSEEFAHKEDWINGKGDDDARDPLEVIEGSVQGVATRIGTAADVPAYFPQHTRGGELRIVQVTLWKKL